MKGGGRSLSHLTIVVLCLCRSQFYAVGNNQGGGQPWGYMQGFRIYEGAHVPVPGGLLLMSAAIEDVDDVCRDHSSVSRGNGQGYVVGRSSYLDYENCKWGIVCDQENAVPRVTFLSFSIELSYDFVNVFDGGSNTDTQLVHWSGNSPQGNYWQRSTDRYRRYLHERIGSSNEMRLQFTSDCEHTAHTKKSLLDSSAFAETDLAPLV